MQENARHVVPVHLLRQQPCAERSLLPCGPSFSTHTSFLAPGRHFLLHPCGLPSPFASLLGRAGSPPDLPSESSPPPPLGAVASLFSGSSHQLQLPAQRVPAGQKRAFCPCSLRNRASPTAEKPPLQACWCPQSCPCQPSLGHAHRKPALETDPSGDLLLKGTPVRSDVGGDPQVWTEQGRPRCWRPLSPRGAWYCSHWRAAGKAPVLGARSSAKQKKTALGAAVPAETRG